MNMFAFIQLQQRIAARIRDLSDLEVRLGRYVHQADSYHIYGSYLAEFQGRFLRALETRPFEQRTFCYRDVKDIMEAAIPGILAKAAQMGRDHMPSGGE